MNYKNQAREYASGSGRLWTHQEKCMLRYMRLNGYPWEIIGVELGRKTSTVTRYWYNYQKELLKLTSYSDLMKRPFKSNKC